jgi:hypothetical protein
MKRAHRAYWKAANRPKQLEFRWRCGVRTSRWFKSYRSAGNDAERHGLAIWEGDRLWPGPLVEIEERPAEGTKKAGQA